MSNEIIAINNDNLMVKEYKKQRVVTLWDIARLHNRDVRDIRKIFERDKKYLIENEDFYLLEKQSDFAVTLNHSGEVTTQALNASKNIPVFTESGYLMMTKPMQDELSWQVQRQLVKSYFKVQEIKQHIEENNVVNFDDKIEKLKLEQQGLKLVVDLLKPSKASTVKILRNFNESQGLSTAYFPVYVDEKAGTSATSLLRKFDISMSTIKFNKLMLEHGFLEENERKSTKGTKKYWTLTEKGLKYGKNLVNDKGSEKETQPLYYENTFMELINFLGCSEGVM